MATAYILKDAAERIYIGSTTDMERRLSEHRRGHTATTRKMDSPRIAWCHEVSTLEQAREIERKIKKWKSRYMIELLIAGKIEIGT